MLRHDRMRPSRRRPVLEPPRNDRDGRDVHGQSPEGPRHRRADRVGCHAVVDVAHPLGHSDLRVHAAREFTRRRVTLYRGVYPVVYDVPDGKTPGRAVSRDLLAAAGAVPRRARRFRHSHEGASSPASRAARTPCRSSRSRSVNAPRPPGLWRRTPPPANQPGCAPAALKRATIVKIVAEHFRVVFVLVPLYFSTTCCWPARSRSSMAR